jgi:hypothetical protein
MMLDVQRDLKKIGTLSLVSEMLDPIPRRCTVVEQVYYGHDTNSDDV